MTVNKLQSEKRAISKKIGDIEHLRNQLISGRQDKELAETAILHTLNELDWAVNDDIEQKARLEEVCRYIEILSAMSRDVMEEEEYRLNVLIENLQEEEDRIQEKLNFEKADTIGD